MEQRYQAVLEVISSLLPVLEVAVWYGVSRQKVYASIESPSLSVWSSRMADMSKAEAGIGNVYLVYRNATTNPVSVGNRRRPMVCVATQRADPIAWRALARSSTDGRSHEGDVYSPAQPELEFDKDGHWSLRWQHNVLKAKTDTDGCAHRGCLTEPELGNVLTLYRKRKK